MIHNLGKVLGESLETLVVKEVRSHIIAAGMSRRGCTSVRPFVRNTFSQIRARRIFCRVFDHVLVSFCRGAECFAMAML